MGNLPVIDVPTKVLFDTGASHCFISRPFASKHGWYAQVMHKPLAVVSPGRCLLANYEIPDISISMGDFKFLASPMVLGNSDIDLILGMDWLPKHKAQLDGYVPIPPPFYIVPAKMSAGFTKSEAKRS